MKTEKEVIDFFIQKHEIELTDELILELVKEKKWGDVKSLKEMRKMGAKWNTKNNSIVIN
jgi:hypothetical protein